MELRRLQAGEEKRCVAEETAEQSCLKAKEEECRPVEKEAAEREKAAEQICLEVEAEKRR